jgi:predicted transcriptional regulator
MSTTTIRLSEELKQRVAEAAEREGLTPHAFMVDAIAEKTEQAALRAEFYAVAEERLAEVERTGLTVSREDMQAYVAALVAGDKPTPPKARKLPR